jgi:glycosyltransferase involved in cell wall biosynthesis
LPPGGNAVYVSVANTGLQFDRCISTLARRYSVKPMFFVHDLIPIYYQEYACGGDSLVHEGCMRTMLQHGACLLTASEAVAYETYRYARDHGLDKPTIWIAPLGPGVTLNISNYRRFSGTPYFVLVGTIEPRKNHYVLLHVWRQLVQRMGVRAPKLVIIGRNGWDNGPVMSMIERSSAIRSHVLWCGAVPDQLLGKIIAGASALLFPSFAEGFGLPLIEALAQKVPVIASDIPVFREIGKGIPEFVAPLDGQGWEQAIERYAHPCSAERTAQLERIKSTSIPSWDTHFSIFERCLESLLPAADRRPLADFNGLLSSPNEEARHQG